MKTIILTFAFLFSITPFFAQDYQDHLLAELNTNNYTNIEDEIGSNGFDFTTLDTGINTKYSEYGSGFFMNKFIMVSSKKLGALSKTDKQTGEGYQNLFCLDISNDGSLKMPLLFSRIINTFNNNEGQLSFSPDEHTMYFTRSTKEDTSIFKLYKVSLEKDSHGNWVDQELLHVNTEGASVENPFVSPDGTQLYFSSNKEGGFGGFDLYVATINADGSLGDAVNLGDTINTQYDDKFPSLSTDGKDLYFSSRGHNNMGGFDIFKSKIIKDGYRLPRNLGNTINSNLDDVAFFMASQNRGYLASNKAFGKGKLDIFSFTLKDVSQSLEGMIVDLDSKIPLPNTLVILLNEEGEEIARQTTNQDAKYTFTVNPFETYTITTTKEGFNDKTFDFVANIGNDNVYNKDLELEATEAVIETVEEKKMIVVNNIYFDYNKWSIKDESLVQLNSIARILKEHPEMKIEIGAHTDNRGNDKYNLSLSKKRAASAMSYLIESGVDPTKLFSNGYGEAQPLVDCKTNCKEEDHQKNRRIEFVIID
ncbi:OmpA family protein [Lacinutrix chionoecetis]